MVLDRLVIWAWDWITLGLVYDLQKNYALIFIVPKDG
jgi:hypothetical protein